MTMERPTKFIQVRLPSDLHKLLRVACAELSISISEFVREALKKELGEEDEHEDEGTTGSGAARG
jgi:predicted HicB family RNase H-like nuclease